MRWLLFASMFYVGQGLQIRSGFKSPPHSVTVKWVVGEYKQPYKILVKYTLNNINEIK